MSGMREDRFVNSFERETVVSGGEAFCMQRWSAWASVRGSFAGGRTGRQEAKLLQKPKAVCANLLFPFLREEQWPGKNERCFSKGI